MEGTEVLFKNINVFVCTFTPPKAQWRTGSGCYGPEALFHNGSRCTVAQPDISLFLIVLLLEGPADARAHSSSRRGINVESRQQVLKDMWPGEKAVPPAGYSTSSKIQLHNIYSSIPSVSGVRSCKEGRINLFSYDCLHGAPSSSLAVALSRPRRERTALCANFCVRDQSCF